MAKAIATYAGGIQSLIECAIREDGAKFMRYQNRTPYGYRWTAWKLSGQVDVKNLPESISAGFSNLYPRKFGVRLP